MKLSTAAEDEETKTAELRRQRRIQMDQYNMQLAKEQQAQWVLLTPTLHTVLLLFKQQLVNHMWAWVTMNNSEYISCFRRWQVTVCFCVCVSLSQDFLNQKLYTNKPTKDYFNQFNSSSRWTPVHSRLVLPWQTLNKIYWLLSSYSVWIELFRINTRDLIYCVTWSLIFLHQTGGRKLEIMFDRIVPCTLFAVIRPVTEVNLYDVVTVIMALRVVKFLLAANCLPRHHREEG